MHLYVIARANKDRLDRWINDVTAQYLPYEYEKGKVGRVQIGVRPVQLLEIAFPESQLEEVLKIVRPNTKHKQKLIGTIRRMLGLEELKNEIKNVLFYKFPNDNVSITPIGIKRDNFVIDVEQI